MFAVFQDKLRVPAKSRRSSEDCPRCAVGRGGENGCQVSHCSEDFREVLFVDGRKWLSSMSL